MENHVKVVIRTGSFGTSNITAWEQPPAFFYKLPVPTFILRKFISMEMANK